MEKVTLNVNGMECHGCENRIINVLKNIDYIRNVVANYETGIVEIELETPVNIELIKEKINNLGFTVE